MALTPISSGSHPGRAGAGIGDRSPRNRPITWKAGTPAVPASQYLRFDIGLAFPWMGFCPVPTRHQTPAPPVTPPASPLPP